MDRQEIIRMAREACDQAPREDWNSTAWVFGDESLVHFAALVAAAERENIIDIVSFHGGSVEIEAAIRSRSNT